MTTAKRGEITVSLSLIFLLMLSLLTSLLQSVQIQNAKSETHAVMTLATESVFAEYQKELFEMYDLFVIDSTYEGVYENNEGILQRLYYYGGGRTNCEVQKIRYLSDNNAKAMLGQIDTYMRQKYGLSQGERIDIESKDSAESLQIEDWIRQEEQKGEQLQGKWEADVRAAEAIIGKESLEEEENPLSGMEKLNTPFLLELILGKEEEIPKGNISKEELPSLRPLQSGYGTFQEVKEPSKMFLGEYIEEHFDSFISQRDGAPLQCEMEYLLEGKESDQENLQKIAEKLLLLRMASNYLCLIGDEERKAEARMMAAAICTLLLLPELTEAAVNFLIVLWSFGESIMDLRVLFRGGKVALQKTKEQWQLTLSSLFRMGKGEWDNPATDDTEGISYTQYLKACLLMEERGMLAKRMLDIMELNMRMEKGCEFFRVDACVTALQVRCTSVLSKGITYTYPCTYQYH